ncbi:MAG: Fic family protein [Patescibacteria group bacterium]|nr:Fic family protein [Patescibacteria group bacterium]
MTWNWQDKNWPKFIYDTAQLEHLELEYAHFLGRLVGTIKHLANDDKNKVIVNILSTEGAKTAEIEGEMLDRDSLQASIRKKLGLETGNQRIKPAEAGMAEVMTVVYMQYNTPLTHEELHHWNAELMQGRTDLESKGDYRKHEDPMQVVSRGLGMEKVHFEAPPSKNVQREMEQFIQWFNDSLSSLPPLTRAGIAHLYSVCIHPYEDGNGRMARAITEKALSQSGETPALSGLSRQIAAKKNAYYDALERNNKTLDITDWLFYFAKTTIEAQIHTLQSVERVLQKAALHKEFSGKLNDRQKKVIDKLYEAEPEGFKGGLSAKNYIVIAKASRATTTRDLQELVELGILEKSGTRRFTRYRLTALPEKGQE